MHVLFISQYGLLAASSRTRVFQYLPYLESEGISTSVISVLTDRTISGSQITVTQNPLRKLVYYLWAGWRTVVVGLQAWRRARRADILFVQKVIFPRPIRWLLRSCRAPIVFDFDDAIFTTEVRQENWIIRWKERRNKDGLPAMLQLADLAIVENSYTEQFAKPYCEVFTITGPVDTERHRAVTRDRPSGERGVVLGWIGSGTSAQYLELIREPLRRLSCRFPDLIFRIVGVNSWEERGVRVETKSWCLEEEEKNLHGFDIGLMPIADDPWTRGKGGYKLLQYMSSGLPVVTSPVGINCEIVEDGRSGYWATTSDEWEDRIGRLVCDADLRQSMGQCGRACVEAKYALSLHQQRLLTKLREMLPT